MIIASLSVHDASIARAFSSLDFGAYANFDLIVSLLGISCTPWPHRQHECNDDDDDDDDVVRSSAEN